MTRKTAAAKGRKSAKPAAFGRSLARGLRQAVAYERGKLKGRVEVYNVPPAVDVRKIREKAGHSG